jgi:hypothetical protein
MNNQPCFPPLSANELLKILGATIKQDEQNKLVTFLCELSAYTENSPFNISFNAPSSTGKSYIPLEIASLFPQEDVTEVSYCSPTAFFHDHGEYLKDTNTYLLDLSQKILIFLDQPHTLLLEHLRPLLSHDKKEIKIKITDKAKKGGLKTKNIVIKGYPAVIFCTGNLKIDEQESTRFFLLSPEISQEKIRAAIHEKIKKETDSKAYSSELENYIERHALKQRIVAIKKARITDIKISSPKKIEEIFLKKNKILKPRHMRDTGRFISLAKTFALLNLWHRERKGTLITVNDEDIEEALKIWAIISDSQELNLPPYIFNLYKEIIVSAYNEKKHGITRQEIMKKHYQIHERPLPDWQLRQQILPMLEAAGLIVQEADSLDKRKVLIFPADAYKKYSERGGG